MAKGCRSGADQIGYGMHRFFKWFGLPGKVVLTALMSLLAVLMAVLDPTMTRILCIPAMLVSSLGDIILMNYRPITDRLPFKGFIPGAVTFAVSHVLYFIAFLFAAVEGGRSYFNAGAYFGIIFSACLLLWMTFRGLKRGNRKMLPLGMLYILFISLNFTTVFSCAVSHGGIFILSAVGVVSFLISDLMIAEDVILNDKIKNADTLIWTFYPIGQIFLIIGA